MFYWPGAQRPLARRVPPPPPLEAGHGDGDLGTVRLPRRQGRARRPPQGPVRCPRLRGDLVVSPAPDGTAASRPPGRSPALAPRRANSATRWRRNDTRGSHLVTGRPFSLSGIS